MYVEPPRASKEPENDASGKLPQSLCLQIHELRPPNPSSCMEVVYMFPCVKPGGGGDYGDSFTGFSPS